jgi:dihydroorotase
MVQHSLVAMLEFVKKGKISVGKVVDKMCHKPAELFHIKDRGFLKEGYYADLVLIDPDNPWRVEKSNLLYKCGWSPLEDEIFTTQIVKTFVNGEIVYDEGKVIEKSVAMPLVFNH